MERFVFRWGAFLLAFAAGITAVWLRAGAPEVVVRYPHPLAPSRVFRAPEDDEETCVTYRARSVACEGGEDMLPVGDWKS